MSSRGDSPPQVHSRYGEHEAKLELGTLRVIEGQLPARALRLVRQWARLHPDELHTNWQRAQALDELVPIDPLP